MKANTTFKQTADAEKLLVQYDIISFDVFDTLITRRVLRPVDVFGIVEAEARHRGITRQNFASDRRQAELNAYTKYGETANFDQIYDTLQGEFSYTGTQCSCLKQLELDAELRLAVPRLAMKDLLLRLRAAGKRIILCSDMYLSSDAIRALLVQCGYPEDLEIWVSCEKGATKSSGEIWKLLWGYLPAGKKFIHVGDNEYADHRVLSQLGRDSLLIDSGLTLFEQSELYGYLSKYMADDIGHSLILGSLVNGACFNSPFGDCQSEENIVSVWGGPAFACFMDFLVKNHGNSQLLFLTREGYLLKPMYERYCAKLGVTPQCSTLFYSSRAAAIAATVTSEKDVWDAMQRPEYEGTLGHFTKSRMNFDLSFDPEIYNIPITLPAQQYEVFKLLKPYFPRIFGNGKSQKDAYLTYISGIRQNGSPLTAVDVGYNGTIQFALSKILSEKVSGLYMFLNDGAPPKKAGCDCRAIANPRSGLHPIFDNLLFLEAIMQVPYGQLQKMVITDGRVSPVFNSDANFSEYIPVAQEAICEFTEWIADWKKDTGDSLELDFELAEAIWICLIKFGYLPKTLLESFWLADDFSGNPLWKYHCDTQEWKCGSTTKPLSFGLVKDGTKSSLRNRLKFLVKKHIPSFAYDFAKEIWVKYIK